MTLAAVSKLVRRTHMYLALFLAPWVVIYALSTLTMNHPGPRLSRPVSFIGERELSYTNAIPSGAGDREAARQILADLRMDGPFNVQGSLKQGRLTVFRLDPVVPRRIVYQPAEQRLTIEKEAFELPRFLRRMHTRSGFTQPYAAATGWALAVDLAAAAMVFWAASGAWMWWELKAARFAGGFVLAAGLVLYVVFLANL